ncbi:MAG TPA: GIY-YIG nuclease family protein [Terriglobales bacterium]|nr:GIY-YIG nuclease family protein [Terriglobales bacterium]
MIRLNTLLQDEGIDPAHVKIIRHQDTRQAARLSPYQLWLAADGRLDLYQRIQRRPVFKGARLLASFVATPLNETLFVGMYENKGVGKAASGLIDPISGKDVGGLNFYDLVQSPRLAEYRGRLIIEWGQGYRSWVQLARKKEKRVVEMRRTASEPPFPGFLDFCERLSALAAVPASWRAALSAVAGIYLLTNPDTGKQYVGSAQGVGGFWGRWEQYAASGHGGNRRMQDIPAADYQVSVLEVASSSSGADALAKMEGRWKQKLLSRKFGLNAN